MPATYFKPLLAVNADLSALVFPMLASPKMDGIRCLITDDGPVTRSLKPIPNDHIRSALAVLPVGYDGEILTFTLGKRDDFNTVQSKVMNRSGYPEFKFNVFDNFAIDKGFSARLASVVDRHPFMTPVPHIRIEDMAALDIYERRCVEDLGWEGVMLRAPHGPYKFGRSTVSERILLKVKRFTDDEAIIVGTVEQMENQNEARENALGHTERSSHRSGLVPKDTLGAIQCDWKGVRFEIGTGFTQAQRDDLWSRRDSLKNQKVTFKYQGTGPNGAPRFPVFLGIRRDL